MGQLPFSFARERATGAGEFFGDGGVVRGRRDDRDIVKILGGGADHGGSADIDVFDQLFEGHTGLGGGFFEGVEIDHDHVDGLDAVLGYGGGVRGKVAAVENASVNFGMQRLDAAIEHFGEAGEIGDVLDGNAGVAQEFGGASGGDEFDVECGELAGEIDQSGLIGDAENGTLDFGGAGGHVTSDRNNYRGATEDSISKGRQPLRGGRPIRR